MWQTSLANIPLFADRGPDARSRIIRASYARAVMRISRRHIISLSSTSRMAKPPGLCPTSLFSRVPSSSARPDNDKWLHKYYDGFRIIFQLACRWCSCETRTCWRSMRVAHRRFINKGDGLPRRVVFLIYAAFRKNVPRSIRLKECEYK